MVNSLETELTVLKKVDLYNQVPFSKSQLYEWNIEIRDRKRRESKGVPQETVANAASVILKYPFFGGLKGGVYMVYHRLGFVSRHTYDTIRMMVRRLVFQEVTMRNLLPDKEKYHHERPNAIGEVWAEDFTQVIVEKSQFYISLVIDVKSSFYLGLEVSHTTSDFLVASPIKQSLEKNHGKPPNRFLLSDNGREYTENKHELLLKANRIAHKLIPSAKPQYNGAMECGVKEFKNVFYNIWYDKFERADKEKSLLDRVRTAAQETAFLMNHEIPRPHLEGVTPRDVHSGQGVEKISRNKVYCEKEATRNENLIKKHEFWRIIKKAIQLDKMNNQELQTKFMFFGRKPLRNMANLGRQGVG